MKKIFCFAALLVVFVGYGFSQTATKEEQKEQLKNKETVKEQTQNKASDNQIQNKEMIKEQS